MATEILQEVTLRLPSALVERMRIAAKNKQRTQDQVVADILNALLPPLEDADDEETRRFILDLAREPEAELRRKAEARLSDQDQERLSELLEYNGERKLTSAEQEELEGLLDKVTTVAMESIASKWILSKTRSRSR